MTGPVDFSDPLACERFIKEQFAGSPDRLQHILVVADRVRQSARDLNELGLVPAVDEVTAFCAALVHDIGYIESLRDTGFHPVDGASFLRARGFTSLADLIVGHSTAPEEATLRGLPPVIVSEDPIAKLLTYWDMQTGPSGEILTFEQRMADILSRHGEHSVVGQAMVAGAVRIRDIIDQVNRLLQRHPS